MNVHRSSLSDESGASRLGAAEAESFLASHPDVQYIDCVFVDLCGNVRGKRVGRGELEAVFGAGLVVPHSIYFLDARGDRVESCGALIAGAGTAWPVAGSLTPVSWAQRPHGQVLMTLHDERGEPFFGEPRNVLRRVLARHSDYDVTPHVGVVIDATLIESERTKEGTPQPVRGDHAGIEGFQTALLEAAKTQALPALTFSLQDAQLRVGFEPVPSAIAAADHAVFLRQVVRAAARKHRLDALVMAKPLLGSNANAMSVSMDLRRSSGESIFSGASGGELMRFAVGGVQALLAESLALFAPSAHAFRRFAGKASAPRNRRWGYENGTSNLAVAAAPGGHSHVVHRAAGADANPYLALAAMLAGLHYGIGQNVDAGQPTDADVRGFIDPTFPVSIDAALLALENGGVLREYLGPDYVDLYCATKRAELERFRDVIPAHEYDWYA